MHINKLEYSLHTINLSVPHKYTNLERNLGEHLLLQYNPERRRESCFNNNQTGSMEIN